MEAGPDQPGWLRLQRLAPEGLFINFQPVSEPKVGKVRLHLNVLVGDLDTGVARVLALGGADTGARENLPRGRNAVMQTYGHFPLLAMIAETGEVLTGLFRPGNAGANKAEDHVIVLAAAIAQLPDDWKQGHQPGDDPGHRGPQARGQGRRGRRVALVHRGVPGPQHRLQPRLRHRPPGPRRPATRARRGPATSGRWSAGRRWSDPGRGYAVSLRRSAPAPDRPRSPAPRSGSPAARR